MSATDQQKVQALQAINATLNSILNELRALRLQQEQKKN